MQFGDILASPFFWILTGVCIAACIYAKRNVVEGIIAGVFAPMIIIPFWIISALAINVPHLMVRKMCRDLFISLEYPPTAWSAIFLFVTDPGYLAALFTAVMCVWYCIAERRTAHLPRGSYDRGTGGRCSNILRRETWR